MWLELNFKTWEKLSHFRLKIAFDGEILHKYPLKIGTLWLRFESLTANTCFYLPYELYCISFLTETHRSSFIALNFTTIND